MSLLLPEAVPKLDVDRLHFLADRSEKDWGRGSLPLPTQGLDLKDQHKLQFEITFF